MRNLTPGIRLLEPADYRRMRWKNSQGWTTEVAVHPADAGLNGKPFDWRISVAEIERDGDFSAFPGYDRTILLAEGAGMELSFDAAPPQRLAERYLPFRFKGEWHTQCRLLNGPVQDFNVISRRECCNHALQILHAGDFPKLLPNNGRSWLLHVFAGEIIVTNRCLSLKLLLKADETLCATAQMGAQGLRMKAGSAELIAALVVFIAAGAASWSV